MAYDEGLPKGNILGYHGNLSLQLVLFISESLGKLHCPFGLSRGFHYFQYSFGYLFSGMFGAVFNIVMNFALIPRIGVYGAAIATCVSYILVFVFRFFHTQKYIRYNIKNKEFLVGSVVLLLSSCLMFVNNLVGFVLQCVLLLIAIYSFSDIWLPVAKKMLKIKGRK